MRRYFRIPMNVWDWGYCWVPEDTDEYLKVRLVPVWWVPKGTDEYLSSFVPEKTDEYLRIQMSIWGYRWVPMGNDEYLGVLFNVQYVKVPMNTWGKFLQFNFVSSIKPRVRQVVQYLDAFCKLMGLSLENSREYFSLKKLDVSFCLNGKMGGHFLHVQKSFKVLWFFCKAFHLEIYWHNTLHTTTKHSLVFFFSIALFSSSFLSVQKYVKSKSWDQLHLKLNKVFIWRPSLFSSCVIEQCMGDGIQRAAKGSLEWECATNLP